MTKAGKPKANKSKSTKKSKETAVIPPYQKSISVDLDKAKNGYIVSSYRDTGQIKYIAKTKAEAMAYAEKLLRKQ